MTKPAYEHLFAVDENRGIRANVVYKKLAKTTQELILAMRVVDPKAMACS